MSTIAEAFEKDREVFFLLDLELDGWHKRLTDCRGGVSVGYSGSDPLLFEGLMQNTPEVYSSYNLSGRRFSSTRMKVVMGNEERFQDIETYIYTHDIACKVWLWSRSLDFTDIEDYPIFQGTFRKLQHTKYEYSFEILDFTSTRGRWVDSLTVTGNPGAVAKYLTTTYTLCDNDQIDRGSFNNLEDFLTGFSFSVTVDEGADIFDVVDRVLAQTSSVRVQRRGKVAVDPFDKFGEVGHVLKQEDLVSDPVVSLTPFDMVTNRVKVHYNPSAGAYGNTLSIDWTNDDLCERSYNTYGEQPERSFQCPDCATAAQARNCLRRYLDWNAMRHDIVTVLVPYHVGFDMEEGDIAELTINEGSGGGWTDEKFMLLDRTFGSSSIRQRWWRVDTD